MSDFKEHVIYLGDEDGDFMAEISFCYRFFEEPRYMDEQPSVACDIDSEVVLALYWKQQRLAEVAYNLIRPRDHGLIEYLKQYVIDLENAR